MLIKTPQKFTGLFAPLWRALEAPRYFRELQRHIRNFNYDVGPDGYRINAMGFGWNGVYSDAWRNPRTGIIVPLCDFDNTGTTEGANHMLQTEFGGGSQSSTWYIAISSANATPATTWTAANYASNATEITSGYDEATRQEWTDAAAASASKATTTRSTFTANGDMTVYGNALLSLSTKGGTTGTLAGAALRSSSVTIPDGNEYLTGFTITLTL
jgi:hypothetical protein